MNWRVVFSIVQKDLVDAIKNLYLLFCILMPIGMSLMFQVVIPSNDDIGKIKVVLYDPQNSRYGAMLHAYKDAEIIAADSEDQIAAKMKNDSEIVGGIAIPAGFDAALDAGQKPTVKAWLNSKASSIHKSVFRSFVTEQAWLLVRQEFPLQITWDGSTDDESAGDETANNGPEMPFNISQYILQIMLVMGISMMGTFLVPTLMVEEKEKHTLEALLVAPGGPVEVAVGKAIVGMVYSLLVGGILLAMNSGFMGNWPVTVAAVTLCSLFIVGLGLLMGTLFKTMHQVNIASSVLMMLLFLPPWIGLFGLPAPLDTLVRGIPTYYLSQIVDLALMGKATFATVWVNFTVLAVCSVITLAAVVWALRRERK